MQKSEEDRSSPDSIPEFKLRDTAADIQQRREEREAREREEEAQKQRGKARREQTRHSPEEGVAEKPARTDKRDTEMNMEKAELDSGKIFLLEVVHQTQGSQCCFST